MKTILLSITIILVLTGCGNNLQLRINSKTKEFSISERYFISKVTVDYAERYYDSSIYEIICINPENGVSQLSLLDTIQGYQYFGMLDDSIIRKRNLSFEILAISKQNKKPYWFNYLSDTEAKDTIFWVKAMGLPY
jgi:hypothetical protein